MHNPVLIWRNIPSCSIFQRRNAYLRRILIGCIICFPQVVHEEEREEMKRKKAEEGPGRKGSLNRKSYDYNFKMEVVEVDAPIEDVALQFNIHKSLVSKWKKDKSVILDRAMDEHKKLMKKGRPSNKHKELFRRLYEKFKHARKIGRMVSFSWLYTHASKIKKEMDSTFDKRGITLVRNNSELYGYVISGKTREHLTLVLMWRNSPTSSRYLPARYIICGKSRELVGEFRHI